VHEFELLPPPDEPDAGAAPADREPSMQEMLDILESLSVNIKTFKNDPSGGAGGKADEILNNSDKSRRGVLHRKERTRLNPAFARIPSMNCSGSFGRSGGGGASDGGGDGDDEHKLVGTLFSEVKMVAHGFAHGGGLYTLKLVVPSLESAWFQPLNL
jgi:hypothetical protein